MRDYQILLPALLLLTVSPYPSLAFGSTEHITYPYQNFVLQAINLSAGHAFFRHPLEIAVSKHDREISVLFRQVTSGIIIGEGRKPTKDLWEVTFIDGRITTEVFEGAIIEPFDKHYTEQEELRVFQAVAIALTHVWNTRSFQLKEFAIHVIREGTRYTIAVFRVPYSPDAVLFVKVSHDLKVIE